MRIIHYFMMFVFILFSMFMHIYLANIEGLAPTKLMFFWHRAWRLGL